ncbi:hypothetical protein TrVE_jg12838 [Triparma verrucosa]|uniref:SAM domain-containing protein n=1 Tax=Triparma verrucosa TaxID=1606542 RepID=A0A9W7CC64_9STRA|nr:hypothetical protein TrVE_jg12838 [Triparma verrucosa]
MSSLSRSLRLPAKLSDWSELDVARWLNALGLGEYSAAFVNERIIGYVLEDLTLDDLVDLGILRIGDQKLFFKAVDAFCREEAVHLGEVLSDPKFSNVQAIATVKEANVERDKLGLAEFSSRYFHYGPVFLNRSKDFWTALGSRSLLKQKWTTYNPISMVLKFRKIRRNQNRIGVAHNFKGEGILQGGIIIYDSSGEVVYVYHEKTFFDIPKEEIREALSDLVHRQ